MCIGTGAIVGLVLSAAQSVVSMGAANEDYAARTAQWKQNQVNALAAGRDEQAQVQLRMIEEQDALVQKEQQATVEGAEIRAEAEVSAASAGVSGISLGNILTGVQRDVNHRIAADKTNYLSTVAQLGKELEATNTRIKNRINSVAAPTKPNPIGSVLSGVGGALKSIPS